MTIYINFINNLIAFQEYIINFIMISKINFIIYSIISKNNPRLDKFILFIIISKKKK